MAGVDGVVRLERSQTREAAEVLARAFHDDPFYEAILPDEESRPKRLAWFMEKLLRYGLPYGHVYTTPAVAGVACWFPPGHLSPAAGDILRSGLYALPVRLGFGAYRRLTDFMKYAETVRVRRVPEPHWYLLLLGVDGKGVKSGHRTVKLEERRGQVWTLDSQRDSLTESSD